MYTKFSQAQVISYTVKFNKKCRKNNGCAFVGRVEGPDPCLFVLISFVVFWDFKNLVIIIIYSRGNFSKMRRPFASTKFEDDKINILVISHLGSVVMTPSLCLDLVLQLFNFTSITCVSHIGVILQNVLHFMNNKKRCSFLVWIMMCMG